MLVRVDRLCDLKYGALMEVYEEGNRENGAAQYPNLSAGEQILRAEQDFYHYLCDFFKTPGSSYWMLKAAVGYAAALRLEPYKDGMLLEALETKPCERRKGYAEELIRGMLEEMKPNCIPIYSHISKTNYPSIRVHEKCGFQRISHSAVYIDGSVNARAYTYCYNVNNPA